MKTKQKTKKDIWFCQKTYGYGWTPCTIQGWLVILFYVCLICLNFYFFDVSNISIIFFIFLTLLLIFLSYLKGEPPTWRWGNKTK